MWKGCRWRPAASGWRLIRLSPHLNWIPKCGDGNPENVLTCLRQMTSCPLFSHLVIRMQLTERIFLPPSFCVVNIDLIFNETRPSWTPVALVSTAAVYQRIYFIYLFRDWLRWQRGKNVINVRSIWIWSKKFCDKRISGCQMCVLGKSRVPLTDVKTARAQCSTLSVKKMTSRLHNLCRPAPMKSLFSPYVIMTDFVKEYFFFKREKGFLDDNPIWKKFKRIKRTNDSVSLIDTWTVFLTL